MAYCIESVLPAQWVIMTLSFIDWQFLHYLMDHPLLCLEHTWKAIIHDSLEKID